MKIGDIVELTIDSLGFNGISIARLNGGEGPVVQLRGGLPGERVWAMIRRCKRSYLEAELVQVLEPSLHRRTPPCPYAGECGGCSWQHLAYNEQLRWKEQHVRDAFERIGHLKVDDYRPILPSPVEFGYRAKMEFACSSRRWIPDKLWNSLEPVAIERKHPAIGLHVRNRYDAVLDIERCLLQDEHANTLLQMVREIAFAHHISCDDHHTQSGFLRNVIIRRSGFGETMLVLITRTPSSEHERSFLVRCVERCQQAGDVQSIVWGINDTRSPVPPGPFTVIYGKDFIREYVAGLEYRISAQSFFQANVPNLERFIGAVLDAANAHAGDVVWDLYAGAGTLTLPLARQCAAVYGVESNAQATVDACSNAERNGISNAQFITADLHDRSGLSVLNELPNPDIVVLDPPRAGMHPRLVEYVRSRNPSRIVYVSCNPTTQARDLALFGDRYRIAFVQPIDMFPQTYHVENIAVLTLRS